MRIINLDPGIHFTIGEADTIQLTMDGLEKTSKKSGSATPFKSSWTVSLCSAARRHVPTWFLCTSRRGRTK